MGIVRVAILMVYRGSALRCLHLTGRRSYVSVVDIKSDVCEWECGDERFDCFVCPLLDPGVRDDTNVYVYCGE